MARPAQTNVKIAWKPQAGPQAALVKCPVFEILYGGARGGGKTDGMLGKFAIKAGRYGKHATGVFFRQTREDLKEAIERSMDIYGPLGARWNASKNFWRFPNGARLKFEYVASEKDAKNYQGHNYTDLFMEELTQWASQTPLNMLKATLRSAHGVPCQFHATANPGGPGHLWVKQRYIDPAPEGWKLLKEQYENPFTGEIIELDRVFIPSKLSDNRLLMQGDPLYVAKLQQSGSKTLVKAWLTGDWSVVEGAYFDNWATARHVVKPFPIPDHWMKFRSADWGSAAPFSIGWWAVVSDDYPLPDGRVLPRGCIVRYREWYGCTGEPNKGLKMTAEQVAKGILERQKDKEPISYGVMDPAAFAVNGGPSIAEVMAQNSVYFDPADNKRVAKQGAISGWDQFRTRLDGEDENRPMMVVFETCKDFIRTVPVLQHDEKNPEDLDTDMEDHVADEARYACMSRPWAAPVPSKDKPKDRYREARQQTSESGWAS
ncbi:MAG: terminase family protein [Cohaesibacter sp.]|jgi:hypothetical protein|nr:terminase family protein [Cohaesibacter sp.]